jgi:REP element-mobilizing transposase RayT
MVAGYHLIWTAYGYWLPNDPRGSTSIGVRVEPIQKLGEIHYGRKAVQPSKKETGAFHEKARDVLKHPVLLFDDEEIRLLGGVVGAVIAESGYVCHACAIMPDHVHVLIRRHRDWAETMITQFQEATRTALIDTGKRLPTHPVWTKGPGWKRFPNTRREFERTIKYINSNPEEMGLPAQTWDFVTPYDGWLP